MMFFVLQIYLSIFSRCWVTNFFFRTRIQHRSDEDNPVLQVQNRQAVMK